MATVPVEITWVTGQVVTAAQLNANVRDAVNFLLSPPICQVRQTVAQSIPNNTNTAVLLDAEDIDNDGMHSTITNTSRLTAATTGRYAVGGGGTFASNTTGVRLASYAVNGTEVPGTRVIAAPVGSSTQTDMADRAMSVFLNAGDYLEMLLYQNSGGALNTSVSPASEDPLLLARWIGTS